MVTIKDVASHAGVSFKTVSRVLNNSPHVSDAVRGRVLDAVDELGYHRNASARRLVTGKAGAVGVVIPQSADYVFTHLYFNELLRGIGEVLDQHNLDLLLHLGRQGVPYADLVRHNKADGLILLAIGTDDPNTAELQSGGYPCIFTSRVSTTDNRTNWVDSDAANGITQAVQHLIEQGHTRIGMLTGPDNMVLAQEQIQAFRQTLATHDLPIEPKWMRQVFHTVEAGEREVGELLACSERATALVCADDMSALGAVRAARKAGLHVPNDLSVTGFDDVILARYSQPPLTTVRQDAHRKGQLAASQLVDMLTTGTPAEPWQCLLPTELIIRESTGPAPAHH